MRQFIESRFSCPVVWLAALAMVVTLPLAAAAQTNPTTDDNLTDEEITQAVDSQLLLARGVSPNEVDLETHEGIVTLTGQVDNILAKERATRVAEMVKGVRSVVNRIQVDPDAARTDSQIQQDISNALLEDPATESWEIGVGVEDGTVALVGTVDSWHEKQLAARVAKSVEGVLAVDNQIDIEYDAIRSDSEIANEVEQTLMWDVRVDDALIDVAVTDGEVELTGTVGSAHERTVAIGDAWTQGVRSVDASDLKVEWWARDRMLDKERYSDLTDEQIHDAIKDALLYDPRVASFRPEVKVENGVVTLTGTVSNLKAKRSAAQTAANTAGVWRVKNRLKVRPTDERTDSEIAQDIRNDLLIDPYVDRYEIDVDVEDGVARLTGEVDSYFEKWQAGDLAATVRGVTVVRNRLDVDYEPLDYDYTFYDWDVIETDYDRDSNYQTLTAKADWEIREDIRDELWWSPFVDANEVTVTVEDGEATLTGTVDSWSERRKATEQALEGGATLVDNRLDVEWGPDFPL